MEYLIKSSAIILIAYLCYKLFLERETFFQSNRWFLLGGLTAAFIIPAVVIPNYITVELATIPQSISDLTTSGVTSSSTNDATAFTFDWTHLAYLIYVGGVIVLTTKFLINLLSLVFLVYNNASTKVGSCTYITVSESISPFSFFNYIVFNPKQFNTTELEHILTHEKVHAKQYHSIDILMAHLASIICWFNPIIWFYKKDLQQNLEFIADQKAQERAHCEKSYQHLLVKASVPNYRLAFTNNFYNSLIKKRIIMLHKSKSKKINQLKMVFILPLLALFVMSFNTKDIVTYKSIPAEGAVSEPNLTTNDFMISDETNPMVFNSVSKPLPAKSNSDKASPVTEKDDQDMAVVVITKDTSDDELESISEKFKKKDITLKFKNVKRNKAGEINSIDIAAKTDRANATYGQSQDDAINPISIRISDGSISIGNGHDSGHRDYVYEIKRGKHKVKKSKNGKNVFVHTSHDDDVHEDHEVIEDGDKIIIKRGDEVKEIKKVGGKNRVYRITSDDADGEVIEIKTEGSDKKNIFVKREKNVTSDGKNIWVTGDDDDTIFEIDRSDGHLFVETEGKNPLYYINGQEVSKEEFTKLDPENIKTVNVSKGDTATKRFGKKAKDGVIEVITKDN